METTIHKQGARATRVVLAVLLVLTSCVGALTMNASKAFADEATLEDTGELFEFYQSDSNTGSHWADSVFEINGQRTYCIDVTQVAHAGATYTSETMDSGVALKIGLYQKYLDEACSNWSQNMRAGYLQFMIWCEMNADYVSEYVTPDNDDFYDVYAAAKTYYEENKDRFDATGTQWNGVDSQNMCFVPTLIEHGAIALEKTSGIHAVTEGNPNYSLAGAVYTIYTDDACQNNVGEIITQTDGTGTLGNMRAGTYYVKETKPSPGYSLDAATYTVAVEPGQTARVNGTSVTEVPQTGTDPSALTVTLKKFDVETATQKPQGAARLEGATFVVKHYALVAGSVSNAAALAGQTPDYTWTVTTDATGNAKIETWTASDGSEVNGLPLGVCSIEETVAPAGYLLNSTVQVFDVVASGTTQHFDLTNVPVVSDQVKRGDLALIKISDGDHSRMAGVPFTITSKTTGEVHTITTDVNGYASTSADWNLHSLDTNGNTAGSGIWFGTSSANDDKGALIYDTYTIEEQPCEANANKTLIPAFDITIARDAYLVNLGTLTNDDLPRVTVSKTDIVTGEELPGANMQISDADGKVVEEWISTSDSHEVSLKPGDYTLHEDAAPAGYLVANDVPFTVVNGTVSQKVVMEDDCTKVDFSKTDIATGVELEGAHLQVLDKDGSIIEEWDTNGTVHRINALVPGDYTLRETSAPQGYEVAEDVAFTVEETGAIQKVEMKDKATPVVPEKSPEPTTPTNSDLPKTGDSFPWWILLLVAGAGAVAITGYAVVRVGDERDIEDASEQDE